MSKATEYPLCTPAWWVPFETILCENDTHRQQYLYLGIGPWSREGAPFDNAPVELLLDLSIENVPGAAWGMITWSYGDFMQESFHDQKTCGTPVHGLRTE